MSELLPSSNQGQVLDDVRRALGRSKTLRPTVLDPFVEASAELDIEDLVSRFTFELTAVGGNVYRVSDKLQFVVAGGGEPVPKPDDKLKLIEQIAARIADVCHSSSVTEGALSGSPLIAELDMSSQLSARGLHVLDLNSAVPSEHNELVARLAVCGAGVTAVDYAIAETGTIVLSSDESNALLVSLLPAIHIALLRPGQISAGLNEVISKLNVERIDCANPCRSATLITGPSRTSDVELTLSIGVHGPKELHVIILD